MAKQIKFGVSLMHYGNVTMNIPDNITTREEAIAYLQEHWDDVPLPTSSSYVNDSDELDVDGTIILDGKELPEE